MPLHFKLAIPSRSIADFEALYVQLPSEEGSMGVLQNHAPLRCVLAPGVVTCKLADNSQKVYAVSAGVASVKHNVVTLLADTAESADSIDSTRARAAEGRARARLESFESGVDRARAEAALARALARIKATQAVAR
ncbi:MAG: ATP synthase epsilon chain [bacterium]|nr:ATP synthase epsilon chain [bacterium]